MSWLLRSRVATSALIGPWAVWQRLGATWRRQPPPALLLLADAAPDSSSCGGALSSLSDLLLDGLLRMAVPKKKVSYTRKRKRIAGVQAVRAPKLQTHLYMCPVCVRAHFLLARSLNDFAQALPQPRGARIDSRTRRSECARHTAYADARTARHTSSTSGFSRSASPPLRTAHSCSLQREIQSH